MSELPGRPDIRQLRRQARELLRAAAGGDPHALSRLGAVSDRVTLSAAQLALAREHGFKSWPALRAEVQRRSSQSRSFGWATPIEIAAGTLSPGELIIGPSHAILDVSLVPSEERRRQPEWPGEGHQPVRAAARAVLAEAMARADEALVRQLADVLVVTDDHGARYAVRVESMSRYGPLSTGPARQPISLRLRLDPVPSRASRWLELRSQAGPATRLLPSPRSAVRVSPPASASASPAERELEALALRLIDMQLSTGPGEKDEHIRRSCSAALGKAAQLRTSGELDPASELPDQLERLCAALTGQHPAGALPSAWSAMLDAAQRTDGPRYYLDVGAALPPIGNTVVHVDCLVSEPGSWRVHLQARPGWWVESEDQQRRWAALSVAAEDNLGGRYHSHDEGATSRGDHTELTLGFRPRLDPRASLLKLTFTGTGEQATAEIRLTPAVGTA